MAKALPFEGLRIVEITVVWAGTFGTQPFSDWGAQVIRVESRQHWQAMTRGIMAHPTAAHFVRGGSGNLSISPPGRVPGPRPWNQYPCFNAHARNKMSITMDVTRPEGLDAFKRLIAKSDMFVENNPAGTLAKYGITYEALKAVRPDIIYIHLPGFGANGPYKNFRTYGQHLEAFAGHYTIMGYPDADPTNQTATLHCDATGAHCTALAALMALNYRNRTGEGQFIDIAQVETTAAQFGEAIMDYTMNGRVQGAMGNRDPSAVQGCYPCKGEDNWINITIGSDREWNGFVKAIGNPSWAKAAKFSDTLSRYKNHDELDQLIGAWTSQQDKFEAMHLLQKHGVAAGPVMNEVDVHRDPHLKARGFFEMVTQADCGTHPYPGILWKMSNTPNKIRTAPCLLGEHNEYVYKEIIGVSDEEYAALEKAGHIGMDYVPGVN